MNFKKTVAVLLTIVMLFGAIPLTAFASENVSITFDKSSYEIGDSVNATISVSGLKENSWFGIYAPDDPLDGSIVSIGWQYFSKVNNQTVDITKDPSGKLTWNAERKAYYYFPAGTYTVAVFNGGDYDLYETFTFTMEAPAGDPSFTINLDKTSYDIEEAINLSVDAENYDPTAWVGIYLQDDTYGANIGVESIVWYYLRNGNHQTVNLRDYSASSFVTKSNSRGAYQSFPSGDYIVYVFEDEGYNVVDSATFSITGGEAPNLEPFVSTDKTTYQLGEPVLVTAGNGTWVGVYAEDETPAPNVSRSWYYVNQANQIPVNIMSPSAIGKQGTFAYKNGNYVVYLFGDEMYSNILSQTSFTISGQLEVNPDDYVLETESNIVNYNAPVKVTASGTGTDGKAWVGLYKQDDDPSEVNSYYWYYVSDYEGKTVDILKTTQGKSEELEPGEYKLVLFANDTQTLPVSSLIKNVSIVKKIISEEILSPATCENSGLKRVTYYDDTTGIVTIPPLGGNHQVDDDGFDIIKEPTCTEPGLKEGKCSICGAIFTVDAEAYGHLYSGAYLGNGDGTHSRSCGRNGCDAVETKPCVFGSDDFTYGFAIYRSCSECDATSIYSFSAPSNYTDKIIVTNHAAAFAGQYEIKLCNEKGTVLATRKGMKASETFTGLTAGTYYKIQVRIINEANGVTKNSPWVSYVSPTLPKANAISTLTAATKKVTVQYGKVAGVTGYQVEYSKNADFSASKKATIKSAATVKTTISSLSYNTKYYFRVRTYKTINGTNYFSSWSGKKSITVKPVIAAGKLTSLKAGKAAFAAKWAKVAGITGYQIQYATNAKFTGAKTVTVKSAKTLTKTISKLKGNTKYYVRVRTYKTISKVNYFSAWSAAAAVKTKK